MARLLRLTLSLALCSMLFSAAACEDDPEDLDHVDGGDHGGDEEDGG